MKKRQVWVRNYSELAKQRIKNHECPNCGLHKTQWKRRTDYRCCSKKCSEEFYRDHDAILDWKEIRRKAFKRDNYTCVKCGKKDCASALIGDHIIPIACGGDEFDLDNVQTLCWDCNKKKTRSDMKRIAEYRKCEKLGIPITEQKKLVN
jgi:5-methylcytosine-specific restriction endonuclease McrA